MGCIELFNNQTPLSGINQGSFGDGCFTPVIPDLGSTFQPEIVLGEMEGNKQQILAEMAMDMLDRVDLDDIEQLSTKTINCVLQDLLENWALQHSMNFWSPTIILDDTAPYLPEDQDRDDGLTDEAEMEEDVLQAPANFWLQLSFPNNGCIDIGTKMDVIHQVSPVLAKVLLSLLDHVSAVSAYIDTPMGLLGRTQYFLWSGEGDEEYMVDCQTDGLSEEERQEFISGIISRAAFDSAYPAYALDFYFLEGVSERQYHMSDESWISLSEWENLEFKETTPAHQLCREALAIAKRMMSLLQSGATLPGLLESRWTHLGEPAVVLHWGDPSLARRIEDDIYQSTMNEGEGTDISASTPIVNHLDFSSKIDQLTLGFRLLSEAANLITHLEVNYE